MYELDFHPGISAAAKLLLSDTPFQDKRFPTLNTDDALFYQQRAEQPVPRGEIIEAITATHEGIFSEKQRQNIELLAQENTLAIVSGQQAGIFGGVLYTALKGYGAIHRSEELARQEEKYRFVPIFWIEDNDHDREEIASFGFLDKSGEIFNGKYVWSNELAPRLSVSDLHWNNEITALIEQIRIMSPTTSEAEEWMALVERCYASGTAPADGFMALLNTLFAEQGLLFLSASKARKLETSQQFLKKILTETPQLEQKFADITHNLRSFGLELQVPLSTPPLFRHDEQGRTRLHYSNGLLGDSSEHTLSLDRYIASLDLRSAPLGPDALTRPLLQDFLLPTAEYIAGPGEIAYWAELRELYEHFSMVQSRPVFRPSGTLLDTKTKEFAARENLSIADLRQGEHHIEKVLFERSRDEADIALFEQSRADIEGIFERLKERIELTDSTLIATNDKAKKAALDQVSMVEGKLKKAEKQALATLLQRGRKAATLFAPAGKPQERTILWLYFVLRYGRERFLKALEIIAQSPNKHVVVEI